MAVPIIELHGVSKSYPGVVALRDVDFQLAPGEVRALLGKNGAGKSTLIKIMAGVERPDGGSMEIDGRTVAFRSPAEAIAAGIATVHQELSVIPELSVAENIFLGRWPRGASGIGWQAMNRNARSALGLLGLELDPRIAAGRLSVAERQLVEIARALSLGARVLILDEPTSSLVAHEVEILVRVVRTLAAKGTGIIYISHRMDEIRRVATSVTVMRDGADIGTGPIEAMSSTRIVEMMLGTSDPASDALRPQPDPAGRKTILSVRGLCVPPRITDASLEIRAGEVLGIAGVLGSGRTELLQALVGLRPFSAEAVQLEGKPYHPKNLRSAMAAGVYMTPEDRRGEGAVTLLGIDENLVMASWHTVSRVGVIDRGRMSSRVAASIRMLGIKLTRPGEALSNLSGGNQQKVVIGKALNAGPRVLLLDEPTRGVDVGAKHQIYRLMRDMADRDLAVVFVSGEIEEFEEVCDRVLVLRDGAIRADVQGDDIRTQILLDLTMGEQGVH